MNVNLSEENEPFTTQLVYPPIPWDPANAPEEPVTVQRIYAEGDTRVNLDAISELSKEPIFVRVLETGIVTSIQGFFPGSDPLEMFWKILEVGGLEPRPDEWTVVDERPHQDEHFRMLCIQQHNAQGLPLAGGYITLVYDAEGLYAIEGRLKGPLPEVEIGPLTKEELQEREPEFAIEGPFLYIPEVMWFPHVELPPEPMALYAMFGPRLAKYIDTYGNELYFCGLPDDTPESIREFYHRYIYRRESYLPCIHRPLLVVWLDMVYVLSKPYMDPNGPYYHDLVLLGDKGEAPRTLVGWSQPDWDMFYTGLSSIFYGCGSWYVREPKVVYSSKGRACYEKDTAHRIWFEHLAVTLNFEARYNPAWKIKNLSKQGRTTLWDMSRTYDKFIVFHEGLYCYTEDNMGRGASYRPCSEFLLLQKLRIVDTTSSSKTIENLANYFRTYFKHADDRRSIAEKAWGRAVDVEHICVFSYKDTRDGFHVTQGCYHTTAIVCSLLRQVNIPCGGGFLRLVPHADHSHIVFIEPQSIVLHSDDFYTGIGRMQVNHHELIPGSHNAPGKQKFMVPTKDLFLDYQRIINIFFKDFEKEYRGVTRRTNSGKKTVPGSKTGDEVRYGKLRNVRYFVKSHIVISWLDLYFLFQRQLDQFLIRSKTDTKWPYFNSRDSTNYSEDFSLEQREKIICETLKVVHVHGLSTLMKCSYLKNTAVTKDVAAGKLHKLNPPPGCPHSIP